MLPDAAFTKGALRSVLAFVLVGVIAMVIGVVALVAYVIKHLAWVA